MVARHLLSLALAGLATFASPPTWSTPRELIETADISGLSLSPSGRIAVYRRELPSIARNTVLLDWFAVPVDGSAPPRRIASGGDAIVLDNGTLAPEHPLWSADGRYLYLRALEAGRVQVKRVAVDGSHEDIVASDAADVDRFTILRTGEVFVETGVSRAEIEQAERREYNEGILLDASIDPGQAIFRGGMINGRRATQRLSGDWFDRRGLLGGAPRRYLVFPAIGGAGRRATDAEIAEGKASKRPGGIDLGAATQDVRPANTVTARIVAKRARVTVTADDGAAGATPAECPEIVCRGRRVRSIAWLPGRRAIAVHSQQPDGGWRIDVWRPEDGTARFLFRTRAMLSGDWRLNTPCVAGAATLLCVSAAAAIPPRVVAIDLDTGASSVLATPTAPRAERVPRLIDWSTPDGTVFSGFYFAPVPYRRGSRSPLFITYNSCTGYLRGGAGDEWPLALFAEAGIAALCINPPATGGGDDYDNVANYKTALAGVRSAIDALDRAGKIDRGRVGMGGLSFSSEVTAWVLTHSNLLKAVSLASVLMEPAYYWFNAARNEDIGTKLRAWWGLGSPEQTPERWRELAPALNVERVHAPVLFQIPEQEYRYNMELISRLVAAKKPVEAIVFPDEAHIKFQPVHRLSVYERNLAWFKFWLSDEPCSIRCGRHGERWEQLRAMQSLSRPVEPIPSQPRSTVPKVRIPATR